ncbi:MAG: zinc-ribbon domain-containing protein [Planctomycetota bacterium]|nr:zinc-ribbon domain-containing protein [Planctomycetota bacterium]
MNCPKCNREVPKGAAFCAHCGASLTEGPQTRGPEQNSEKEQSPHAESQQAHQPQPPQEPGSRDKNRQRARFEKGKSSNKLFLGIILGCSFIGIIALIGLVAAIVIPAVISVRQRATQMQMDALVRECQAELQRFKVEYGAYPEPRSPEALSIIEPRPMPEADLSKFIIRYYSDDDNYDGVHEASAFLLVAISSNYVHAASEDGSLAYDTNLRDEFEFLRNIDHAPTIDFSTGTDERLDDLLSR